MSVKRIRKAASVGVRKGLRSTRRTALPVAGRAVKKTARATHKRVVVPAAVVTAKSAKFAHHHVARRPHQHLEKKLDWYRKWHEWEYHHHIHFGIVGIYAVFLLLFVIANYRNVFAASDLFNTWNFSSTSDYTLDSGIESSGSSARLKAQNYTSDSSTVALYHLDESSGSTASDSSTNANNASSTNSPSFGAGKLNNAATFDGVNDTLKVNDSGPLSFNFANTLEAWTKFDSGFSGSHEQDQTVLDKGSYKLYYDHTSGKINYEMTDAGAINWTKIGGDNLNNGWGQGHTTACAQATDGTNIYVGLCGSRNDPEVWRWNGSSWSRIGGSGGTNNGWASSIGGITSLVYGGGKLYAGTGDNDNLAEVYEWNGTTWTKIGGGSTSINNSWPNAAESVSALHYANGKLYAGTGRGPNDARLYEWNGTTWTWIGGFGISGYTAWTTGYETVNSIASNGSTLYVGLGLTAGDGDVWALNGTTWTQIGGDGLNSGWAASTYECACSLYFQGSTLYAGLGISNGTDAEVWTWNGTTWTKIGGDGTNGLNSLDTVSSMTGDGSKIYIGTGDDQADDEVYEWNGSTWTKIGGDGVNSGYDNTVNDNSQVASLVYMSGVLYAGFNGTGGDVWSWNGSSWAQIGGDGVNRSWGLFNLQSAESSISYNGKLYIGTGFSLAGNATIWEWDGSSWLMVGGQGLRGSWTTDIYEIVSSMTVYKGELYVGLGTTAGDAEVWKYNGSSWTKIGGDGLSSSWNTGYETVSSLAVYNGDLYAGLGLSANDAEVWRWNGSTWSQIGGDSLNNGWTTNKEVVESMAVFNGSLCAGLGVSAGDAEVWCYNGSSWTMVGGDGVNSSWADTTFERIKSLVVYNGDLYAGLGASQGDAEVWRWNGTTWTQIGGDGVNSSWATAYQVNSMVAYNGNLYAGLGTDGPYSDVWRWNGSTWSQVGGDTLNQSWNTAPENVRSLTVHRGKIYAGLGDNAADPQVWEYGNNAFLSSGTAIGDSNWHHIAATYDGTNMKIFIDGVQDAIKPVSNLMPDTNHELRIGSSYGSATQGQTDGNFKGSLDEIRISNTARASFTTKPYLQTAQAITLNDSVRKSGVKSWDAFLADETTNGGAVTYRVSIDEGSTWLYWNGSSWATSNGFTDANSATVVDDHISDLPVTFGGLKWQAILKGDGDQQVTLNGLETQATSDSVVPTAPGEVTGYKTFGGAALISDGWTNGGSPYFTWVAGTDDDAGVKGYCLYLGTDDSADPATTKGMLGTSPVDPGDCQFVSPTASLNLATSGLLATALTTSDDPYYLRIKTIDNAGNLSDSAAQFQFKFDNVAPTNPAFVNAPGGFVTDKAVTLTWPTVGGNAASDANSSIAGLQYKVNSSSWYGDGHTGTGDANDLLANDGSYTMVDPPDFNDLVDGVNTVYFRTWDNAGNVSSSYVTATLRVNTSGAPSAPQNVQVSPSTNTTNAFAFDWDQPANFVGEASSITYCYTVNTLPAANTCTFTSAGVTNLGAGPYANQPGVNTFYVVARDETSNINYSSYESVQFSANTPAPGIPISVDVVDVSIKATSNWRLALTWEAPTNPGAGISSYKIYRSTDNANFSQVGSSASSTFIDSGLTQQRYYYRIRACDSTNNCGADSSVVDDVPTGRFTTPANLVAEPRVSNITTKKAHISWSTDRESDSRIALGTTSGQYSQSEVAVSAQVTDHEIQLDNLSAGTTYYYVAKWIDEDGNAAQSQEYTFTTSPAPSLKEVTTARVSLSSALVQFTVRQAVKATVYYGRTEAFGGVQSVNTSFSESTYTVELPGLDDGTKYFYKIVTYDNEGTAYEGSIFSFTTPARPRISDLRFQPVEGEPTSTQKVTWRTNVPSSSMVTYGKATTNGTDILDSTLVTEHEIVIRGLEDDSEYFLVAESRDGNGNLARSDRQSFKTALDTRPPRIYDVTVESSIRGTGAEARGQIVVSWKTDELSTSQVAYNEGASATTFNNRTSEDAELATEHIVIISDLPPSRVYSVQPVSRDRSGNGSAGEIKPAIIGRASDGVITIVLNTLRKIFGY